jgi:hypothetical protein
VLRSISHMSGYTIFTVPIYLRSPEQHRTLMEQKKAEYIGDESGDLERQLKSDYFDASVLIP